MAEHPRGFEEFFGSEHARLYGALCLVTGNRHEAEEIMQDVFLRLWERWDRVAEVDPRRVPLGDRPEQSMRWIFLDSEDGVIIVDLEDDPGGRLPHDELFQTGGEIVDDSLVFSWAS